MNKNTVKKFRWFWAWQDEQEEAWLSEMATRGYHLEKPPLFGIYHFHVGDPDNVIYRLDFNVIGKKDRESYLQLFQDAGWEHVRGLSSWAYFRKQYKPGETTEIFSDTDSKIQKYQRIIIFLTFLLPISLFIMSRIRPYLFVFLGAMLTVTIIILWSYALNKLMRRISQLKKNV